MNLKKATKLVYLSLIAELILSVFQWGVYSFSLYSVFGQWAAYSFRFYGAFGQDFSMIAGLFHLVFAIPMILFFGALNAKQNSSASDRAA